MKDMSNTASKNDSNSVEAKMDTQPETHSERGSRKQSSENTTRKRKSRRSGKFMICISLHCRFYDINIQKCSFFKKD